jgi:hypothetical protein
MDNTQIGADHLKNGTVYTTDQILDYYNAVVKMKSEHDPDDRKGIEKYNEELAAVKLIFAKQTILLNEPD